MIYTFLIMPEETEIRKGINFMSQALAALAGLFENISLLGTMGKEAILGYSEAVIFRP